MGCPSPRQGLANPRTGNPTPHPGSPRPNKWEHPDPHREPIRRNSGSVPTGAGANHYPDCRVPGASSNYGRPAPARFRPPDPSRRVPFSALVARRVPPSTPSKQAILPAPFPERACLSPLRASFVAGRKRFSADLLSGPPSVYRRSARNGATANAGHPWRRQGCLQLAIRAAAPLETQPEPVRVNRDDGQRHGGDSGGVGAMVWRQPRLRRPSRRRLPHRCQHHARRRRSHR